MNTMSVTSKKTYSAPESDVVRLNLENGCLSLETQKDGGEGSWDDL